MKNLLIKIFYFLKFHEVFRLLFQKNKTTIIYYHNITPELFEKHLNYLNKKYNIISLADYVEKKVPKNIKYRLIITFDDGHINNYKLLDALKKHNINITIFLVSDVINTNKHYWFKWDLLDNEAKNNLKKLKNDERIKVLAEKYNFNENDEQNVPQALNLQQINELKPFVSFQSHTHTHPCLNQCDESTSIYEIKQSKSKLESLLNNEVFSLAFPNGDYELKDVENAKKLNYKCVLTAKGYYNALDFESFKLKRLSINDKSSVKELALRSSGFYLFFKKFL